MLLTHSQSHSHTQDVSSCFCFLEIILERENDRCTGNPFLFRDRAIDGNSNLVASEVVLDAVVIDEVVIDEVMLDEVVLDKVAPGIGWEAHSRTRRSRTKMRPIHSPVLNNSI